VNLEVKIISDINRLQVLEKDWEAILAQNGYPSIALTPQWLTSWWKSRGENSGKELYILICLEQNKPVAIFPFYSCKAKYRGISIKKLSFMVDAISPHGDFIIASEKRERAIHALLKYLASQKNRWDVIILEKFRDNPNRKFLLTTLDLYNMNYGIQPSLRTPIIRLDKSWDLFWSQRSAKFRKSIRNKLNRSRRAHFISVEKIERPQKLLEALPSIYKISTLSWKGKISQAITDSPVELAFYESFTPLGAPKGWINIWLLKNGCEPIAYEYHLVYNKTVYPLRADFDERYRHLSPGSILDYNIIKGIFEKREYQTYYSCAADYQYLRNWTNNFERLYRVDIFNTRTLSNFLFTTEYKIIPRLRKVRFLRKIKDYLIRKCTRGI